MGIVKMENRFISLDRSKDGLFLAGKGPHCGRIANVLFWFRLLLQLRKGWCRTASEPGETAVAAPLSGATGAPAPLRTEAIPDRFPVVARAQTVAETRAPLRP